MKKLFILTAVMLVTLLSYSQDATDLKEGGNASRDFVDWVCMPDYVFGQVPADYDIGVYCDQGFAFTKVAENYSATGPFTGMKFWGVYDVKNMETFLIEFYDGQPGVVGTNVVYSFNVVTYPIATPYLRLSSVIHEINAPFGATVNLLEGWVSISRTTLPFVTPFAWIGKAGIGNSISYEVSSGLWQQNNYEQFFCLGTPTSVPVSNWALFLGLGLILAFAIFRIRKVI